MLIVPAGAPHERLFCYRCKRYLEDHEPVLANHGDHMHRLKWQPDSMGAVQ